MLWIFVALLATFAWGLAYVFLHPVSAYGVNPYVVQALSGIVTFVLNAIVLVATSHSLPFEFRTLQNIPILLCALAYSVFLVIGGLLYLVAARIPGVQTSILTCITGGYFLVTLAFAWPLWQEYQRVNLLFAIPGILFLIIGLVLLALAQS
jgi:hypothetical protein